MHTNTDSYSNPTEYGSGTTGGAGFGNKTTDDQDVDNSDTRFGTAMDTAPYSGSTSHGSGTVGGAGFGNKTGGFAKGMFEYRVSMRTS